MKRIAAFLVALLLVATCTVFVSAADITATMTSADAKIGDKVTLEVTLAGAPETNAMAFALVDLPQGITFVKKGSAWELEDSDIANFNVAAGQGAFAYGDGVDPNGLVLTLAFEIGEDVVCGENVIKFEFYPSDSMKTPDAVTETAGVITIPHDFEEELTNDDADGHYYACKGCDEKKGFEAHKYSLSCDETCDVCGYVKTGAEHDYSDEYEFDEDEHWYECACGAKDGVAEHNYSYDCDATCNDCGYVREAADHQPVGEVKFDEDGHWGECACGEQIDKTAHEYAFECSTDCEYCDYVREAEHDFSDMASWDEENHWYECMYECGAVDGKKAHAFDQKIVEDEYLYSAANCQNAAVYCYVCECGYCSYDSEFTYEEGEPDPDAHEYYYDYETDTSTCWVCDDVIEDAKGEAVDKIEGNGATINAPEGVLGENFELNVEDFTEEMQEMIPDFGEVLGEEYNGFGLVDFKYYYLTVGDAYADIAEGMTITVQIPGGKKFNDVEPFFPSDDDDDIENIITYTDNGDGTITITLNEAMMNQIADLGAIPVLFIGKPVASGTSDNGLTALWIAVLAVAALGVVATAFYSKKRKATK